MNTKVYLSVVSVVMGCLLWFGTQTTLNWALEREAQIIGIDWAQHLESQLEGSSSGTDPQGRPRKAHLPSADELDSILTGIFNIGHIFQFDYINADCHCHVSLLADGDIDETNYFDRPGHRQLALATQQGNPGERLSDRFWRHVAQNDKPHPNPRGSATQGMSYPLNYNLVTSIIASGSENILIRRPDRDGIPATLAEVFHPVMEGDEVKYLLRMLVNMESEAIVYKQLLAIAALFSVVLIFALVSYPTWRYFKVAGRQKKADRRIEFLANHDVLTNLYNRNNFQETISDILWDCHEKNHSALFFVFDLNDFKEVNDFYGHPIGDKVLCEFAAVLKRIVPHNGYIARLGGDEFVVVIPGIKETTFEYSDYLVPPESVSVQIDGGMQTVCTTIAGGVVRYPQDAESVEELVQLADLALYEAKSERSGQICEYDLKLKEAFFDRLNVRDEFRAALEAAQIVPFYQPIVNMRTGLVEGFEALARWRHPERGILSPFFFAEALEDGETSAMLGALMFRQIADEMAEWQRASVPFVKVALNVTDGDLKSRSFADDILDGLKARSLKSSNLTIEVTENCLFGSDKCLALRHLKRLRAAGCAIALDDFGTGYSSITQLKELPITAIKIDKSFIDDVLENEDDQSIIGAMLDLGRSMNFSIVMEGIETSGQLALLKWMGSELAQGYFFARPMPAAEVPAFIERQNAQYNAATVQLQVG